MAAADSTFRAPIPGQSLTHKMGSLPHEKPPTYVKPDDALNFIWKMITRKDSLKQLWSCMEQDITVWHITRALLFKLAMDGTIQLNLAIVISPTVAKMVAILGKTKGIDVKIAPKFRDKVSDNMMDEKINKKMGRHIPMKLPNSALKSTVLPDADKLKSSIDQFTGRSSKKDALLDQIKKDTANG